GLARRGSGVGARFDEMETERIVERGIATFRGAQDVRGETTIARTRLDEIEPGFGIGDSGLATEEARHLGELNFEQLAEQRADVDAGKEIARAARTPGGAGVVAKLRMVERELHERGHRNRAAFTDDVGDPGFGIRDS